MSLEQKLEELTVEVRALREAFVGAAGKAAPAASGKPAGKTETAAEKKKREKAEADAAKSDGLDDLDDGLGGLEEEEEPAYSYADLRKMMLSLRDIGGKGANGEDAKKVLKKFELEAFTDLEEQPEKFNEVAQHIKTLALKKKVEL